MQSGYVEVRRRTAPTSLYIDESLVHQHGERSFPVRVELVPVPGLADAAGDGTREAVEARYLLGCDGAHSWVRKQLGLTLDGASRDVDWGAIDLFPVTDFRESILLSKDVHRSHVNTSGYPPQMYYQIAVWQPDDNPTGAQDCSSIRSGLVQPDRQL